MKLKNAVAAAAALLCIFFVGCDISDISSDNLLRPPKTMGDEAEIEQLIADSADEDYILKYPKSGNYRSAIIMQDLDGDGGEEAVAFYRGETDAARLHMLVMYCDNDDWKLSDEFVVETTDVDRVDFADICGGAEYEIIVGFNTYTPNSNFLSCYTYDEGSTREITAGQHYTSFYCGDFNADEKNEVMTVTLFSTENDSNAAMLVYDEKNDRLTSKAAVATDPNVVSVKSAAVTSLDDGLQGVVLDGVLSDSSVSTQLIYFNRELSILRNPLYRENSASFTRRTGNIISSDTDDDGVYEIPSVQSLPKAGLGDGEVVADLVTWSRLDISDESIVQQSRIVPCYDYSFSFTVPSDWAASDFTAVIDSDDALMTFYKVDDGSLGEALFELRVFDARQWDKGQNNDEYTLIYKDNRYAYTFKNYELSDTHTLSDDEIKTAFSVLTEVAD